MGRLSREKGKRGERELAGLLREYGYSCRRGQQYCGADGSAEVIGLPEIQARLKGVVIENRDFASILKTHDKSGTLFYLDPLYYDAAPLSSICPTKSQIFPIRYSYVF